MKKRIALFSPSSLGELKYPKQFHCAIEYLESLQFEVCTYNQSDKSTAKSKARIFNSIISDTSIDIIMFNIGGYKAIEMLPYIDYLNFQKNYKKVYGFSDCSVILNALTSKTGLKTFLGPMTLATFSEFPKPFEYSINSFLDSIEQRDSWSLFIPPDFYVDEMIDWNGSEWGTRERKKVFSSKKDFFIFNTNNKEIYGNIIGGNGDSLCGLLDTEYFKLPNNSVLFLEDYCDCVSLDHWIRIMHTFKLHGIYDKIEALVLGKMPKFTFAEIEAVINFLNIDIPVIIDFPFGHIDPLMTIPIGGEVKINLKESKIYIRW